MRNLTACSMALVALLSVCLVACSRLEKSKELAALDEAYRSGVLTPDEYQAKKAALESEAGARAALDKALAAGVITQEEFQARKVRLDATTASLAALETAHRAGVVTNDEYLTKKSALLATNEALPPLPVPLPATSTSLSPATAPAPGETATAKPPQAAAPASAAAPGPGADGHSYRMKMVKVMDAQGFGQPLVSATMLVPTDWQSQGSTTWNLKDKCNTIQTSLRASGPDGRTFEVFPAYTWSWADDPTFLRQIAAQQARSGTHACDVMPAMGAADYLKQNLGKIRPNAKLAAIEPAPQLMQLLQDQARKAEQSAAQVRLQERIRPDVIKARVKYNLNGQPVEEWIIVATISTGTAGLKGFSYNCRATLVAERAPEGKLDSSERFFDLINSTYRVDQTWQGRVTQNALAIQKIRAKGASDRAKIVSKNAEDIRNIQRESYENQQRGQDQSSTQFSQYIRGTETYQNPNTGEKVDLDSKYGNAWVNNRGEYLLSDQAGFDPNTVSQESWTSMQHAKP
jgi:hypothetical protein